MSSINGSIISYAVCIKTAGAKSVGERLSVAILNMCGVTTVTKEYKQTQVLDTTIQ